MVGLFEERGRLGEGGWRGIGRVLNGGIDRWVGEGGWMGIGRRLNDVRLIDGYKAYYPHRELSPQ